MSDPSTEIEAVEPATGNRKSPLVNFRRLTLAAVSAIFLVYGGLLASLFYYFDSSRFLANLVSERTLFSVGLSIAAATMATVAALVLAIPAAYALSRYDFPGRHLIDTLLELPLIVSPAALGAMLLIFFTNPLGNWVQEHAMQFVFATAGVVLAQFVTIVGVAARFLKAAFDEVPPRYETAARTLGATPSGAFFSVSLPLARNGILAASALTWAKAMGEFGATITLAGTMAMRTETLPIAIFMRLSTADIEGTVGLVLLLVGIGLGALFGARLLTRRRFNG